MLQFFGGSASIECLTNVTMSRTFLAGANGDADLDEFAGLDVKRTCFSDAGGHFFVRVADGWVGFHEPQESLGRFAHMISVVDIGSQRVELRSSGSEAIARVDQDD